MSLKEICPIKYVHSKVSPVRCTPKEASFYAYPKGSLTVEAAVVIPLTIGFLLIIVFFFRILAVQVAVEEALIYAGRQVAIESVMFDEKDTLYLSAEALVKQALSKEEVIERYVVGGIWGVSLLGSQTAEKEIVLTANYIVDIPIEFFGKKGLWLSSRNTFVKWKGDLYDGISDGTWVYITETGGVYHKSTSCRSLDLSIKEYALSDIPALRGKNGQKYDPCDRCMKSMQEKSLIYVTDYGDFYHGNLNCSSLKRTISKILLSEVGDRRACSFCY